MQSTGTCSPPAISRMVWACVATLLPLSLATAESARPNVLWIYVDDISDWLGCYGDPIAETPHIDRLADGGVLFENAYMPAPVCSRRDQR